MPVVAGGEILPRSWFLCSALGILWSTAHVAMEALMGLGVLKIGTPLTLLWTVLVLLAVRGRRWAVYLAVTVGALGCYYLAVVHLLRLTMQVAWIGIVPLLMTEEVTSAAWLWPYTVLVYAGIGIGVANLWTGARALDLGCPRYNRLFACALGLLLLLLELYRIARPDGPKGNGALTCALALALFALAVMAAAGGRPVRAGRQPRMTI